MNMIAKQGPAPSWFRLVAALGLALMLGLTMVTSVATAQDDLAEPDGSVRFIHASPDAPQFDVLVDGLPLAQQLGYGTATEYAPMTPGEHFIQVVPTGGDASAAVAETTLNVDSGAAYTVAAANMLNEIEIKTYQSNLEDLDENQSRVRTISLVPGEEEFDVFQTGGDQWFDNVSFGEDSEHRDVDQGPYDLEFRLNDSDTALLTLPGLQINAGSEYSLFLLGQTADDSLIVLPLSVSVQAPCTETLGLEGTPDSACVRIVHGAADAPAVDVYVEDTMIVENLAVQGMTDFVAIPAGDDRPVIVVATGGSIDDPVVDSSIDAESGRAFNIVIGGDVDDLKVLNSPLDLSPLAPGQSRVRVTHVSADAGAVDVIVTDGDTLFENVDFESTTDSIVVNADTYDLQIKRSGEADVLLRAPEIALDEGYVFEVVAFGRVDNGSFGAILVPTPAEVRTGDIGDVTAEGTPGVESAPAEVVETGSPTAVPSLEPTEDGTPTS